MIITLLSSVVSVLVLVLTAGITHTSLAAAVLAATLAVVGTTLLRRALGRWAAALMPVAAAGAGIQSRWDMDARSAALTLACMLTAMVATAITLPIAMRLPAHGRWLLGTALVLCAAIVRLLLPRLSGEPESGQVDLPGLPPFMSGEIGRAAVIIGAALALGTMPRLADMLRTERHPWRIAAAAGALLAPASAFLFVSFIEGDSGPLVVTAGVLGILFAQAFGWWAALLPTLGAVGFGALYGLSTGEFRERWADIVHGDAHGQLSLALRSIDVAGWLHLGEPTIARAVPAGDTDYAVATLISVVGALPVIAAIAIIAGSAWAMLGTAERLPRERQPILVACAWALLLPTAWIVAGNLGLAPFSGIPAPALAGGGSTAVSLGLLLGSAAGASTQIPDRARHPLRGLRIGAAVTSIALLLAVALQSGHVIATGERLTNEWLYRARGDLLARDGTLLAHTTPNEGRTYSEDPTLNRLGKYQIYSAATGIELTTSGALTCGTHHGTLAQLLTLGLLDECGPATVVTTIQPHLQRAATEAAASTPGTSILIVDVTTGGIVAVATHDNNPDQVFADASLPPGSTFKIVTASAAAKAGLNPPVLGAQVTFDGESLGNNWDGPCPGEGSIIDAIASSCNTTFGWLGASLGAEALNQAATDLGFTKGAIEGPPDPTRGTQPLVVATETGTTGLGEAATPTRPQLARTGIGQESVRATLADLTRTFLTAWTGQERALTYTAGVCRHGELNVWATEAIPLEGYDLTKLRAGMRAAIDTGSLKRLDGAVSAGKTGTAQTEYEGQPALVSWLVALSRDGQFAIGIRVAPTPTNLRPSTVNGGAVDVAAHLLGRTYTEVEPGDPCR